MIVDNLANYIICNKCEKPKIRLFSHYRPKTRIKVYKDDKNSTWNGRVCPDCQKEIMRNLDRQRRLQCLY